MNQFNNKHGSSALLPGKKTPKGNNTARGLPTAISTYPYRKKKNTESMGNIMMHVDSDNTPDSL